MSPLPDLSSAPFSFAPVAFVKSCFKAKFGIPRQPGLIMEATGEIEFVPPYNQPNAVRGLEAFSHIWALWVFHKSIRQNWKATVRPPRLGGDKRIGVFASRSPFRPCPIGLSVLKLNEVVCKNGRVFLRVQGLDIVDGTPVLDLKPYVPYSDSLPDARGGFASTAPESEALRVIFSPQADEQFSQMEKHSPGLRELARKVVASDPRPAYQDEPGRVYSVFLKDFEVVWNVTNGVAEIVSLQKEHLP